MTDLPAPTTRRLAAGPAGRPSADCGGCTTSPTEAELTELLGEPTRAAVAKERTTLDELDRRWLAASPFCLVATSGADGSCDVSLKGDPSGFALVLDERTIALHERAGNRRADGYRNVLANPHVGLLFVIPAGATRCGSTAGPGWPVTPCCSTGWWCGDTDR